MINNYKRIFAVLKSTGFNNEWLHSILPEWTGKSSLKELTEPEFSAVLNNLNNIVSNSNPGLLTKKQLKTLLYFKSKLNMSSESLEKFIHHTTGEWKKLNALAVREATAVIIGLKKIYESKSNQNENKN